MLVKNSRGYYTFTSFSRFKNVVHGFSTRKFGDMRFKVSGNEGNREHLLKVLKAGQEYIFPQQVHDNKVARVGKQESKKIIPGVDGLISSDENVTLMAVVADCVPILFYDPAKTVIGVAHAGWKGTVAGISKNLIKSMVKEFNSDPQNIIVGLGPCIEFCHYEVDQDRVNLISEAGLEDMILKNTSGKAFFDIKQANVKQLLGVGVLKDNIDVSVKMCTYERNEFYSWRREKPNVSGHIAGIFELKNG